MLATFDIDAISVANALKVMGSDFPVGDDHLKGLNNERLAERLHDMSYESRYISENMGSVFVLFTLIFFSLVLMMLSKFMWGMLPQYLRKAYFSLKDFLLWNVIIRLYMEAAIELIICTVLNVRYGKFLNGAPWGATLNTFLAYFYTGVCFASPIVIYLFYSRNFKKLGEVRFHDRWGAIYEGLSPTKRTAIWFPVIFVIKRMLFVAIVLEMDKHPAL